MEHFGNFGFGVCGTTGHPAQTGLIHVRLIRICMRFYHQPQHQKIQKRQQTVISNVLIETP